MLSWKRFSSAVFSKSSSLISQQLGSMRTILGLAAAGMIELLAGAVDHDRDRPAGFPRPR